MIAFGCAAGDHERFQNVYFGNYKGYYFTGDSARRDEDGYYWLTGEASHLLASLSANIEDHQSC